MNLDKVLKDIKVEVKNKIEINNKEISNLKKVLKNPEVENYSIYIHNAWKDYPNQVDHFGNGKGLRKTFKRVTNKFMKINNRNDVQGFITIYINLKHKYSKMLFKGKEEEAIKFISDWED